jgi:V/A-type H+-transporting ATPase subunit I
MKKVSLIVHQSYVEDVIKNLHETGMVEIINISNEKPEMLEGMEKASMRPEAGVCTTYELRLSRLIDILNRIKSKPGGLKALLNPQLPEIKPVEDRSLEEIYSYAEGTLSEIEKNILDSEQKLNDLKERKDRINFYNQQIDYLSDFDIDVSDIGESDYLIIKAGRTSDLSNLKVEIDKLDNAAVYSKQVNSGKNREWAILIATHISEREKIEKICRDIITEFDLGNLSGRPKDVLKSLKKEKKDIDKEKKQTVLHLCVFAEEQLFDLLALREEIKLERVKKEISKNFAKTESTYVINGWVLEKNENKLENAISSVSKDHVISNFETPSVNPDNPPTYLETPKWAESFKGLLSMFATPKYNELNPTIIMGIFFVLFFGVMLGDAGYGLTILILSLFGYIKFSRYSEMIGSFSFMGIWLGLTTTVIGLLTNSFFGDFVPRFFFGNPELPLYSLTVAGIHLPAEPLKDPLTILSIALILGLIQLNVGILLGIYQSYKRRDFKEMLTERFCWIPLQLGGGLLIGYFILDWQISTTFMYVSGIMVIVGIILLFISAGPIGFFDITGYVGDWLSYARLLALGLATAGMALAFNVVSQLIPSMIPVVGIILLPILLIILHVVNLALQALGAGVHSLRLQYVEFFNRFYEGGGHEFAPFKLNRKYTMIEEEK